MITQITLPLGSSGTTSVSLVSLPTSPGLKAIEPGVFDAVSTLTSPWTGQTQRQYWPGSDRWSAKCTLPPLKGSDIDAWEAWAMQMTGMLNAVQLGFPNKQAPNGSVDSGSRPVVDGLVPTNNPTGARQLHTTGWKPSQPNILLPNDAFNLGYRYHRTLDAVNSDANGNAVINIWPSLREQPLDGTALVFNSPTVLWSLATNVRNWGLRLPMIMDFSFDLMEYR